MSVRAKFTCSMTQEWAGGNRTARLHPVWAGPDASEEDKAFWEASPSGSLELTITNPAAMGFFKAGTRYYLTFDEAGE